MWLHSLKVAQLLRSAAYLHTNQSRSYLNHLVLVDSGFTFQNFRVVDVVAKAEVSADSGSVQQYYPEDGGRFLLRNVVICIHIMVVSLLRWLDALTAEAWNRFQVSPSAISGGQVALGQVFLPALLFPLSLSFHNCSTQTALHSLSN